MNEIRKAKLKDRALHQDQPSSPLHRRSRSVCSLTHLLPRRESEDDSTVNRGPDSPLLDRVRAVDDAKYLRSMSQTEHDFRLHPPNDCRRASSAECLVSHGSNSKLSSDDSLDSGSDSNLCRSTSMNHLAPELFLEVRIDHHMQVNTKSHFQHSCCNTEVYT